MNYPVFHKDKQVGEFCCGTQGKTLTFSGKCPYFPGIHRFYAICSDEEILPLGVLMPDGEGLRLHRTLRRRDAAELAERLSHGVICPGDERPELSPEPPAETEDPTEETEKAPEESTEPTESVTEPEKPPEIPTVSEDTPSEEPVIRLDRWLETEHPETLTEDPVLQETLFGAPGALYRYRGGRIELALPEEAHAHLAPAMTMVRAEEIRGAHCFVLTFGPDGLPRLADAPSTD